MFKIEMEHNSEATLCAIDMQVHPITKLWRKVASNPILLKSFTKYFKLAKIAMIQVCLIGHFLILIIKFLKLN